MIALKLNENMAKRKYLFIEQLIPTPTNNIIQNPLWSCPIINKCTIKRLKIIGKNCKIVGNQKSK
jgi:hypothetical protein